MNALIAALYTEREEYNFAKQKMKQAKKCFVCKKPGCWSTNRSKGERIAAFRKNKKLRAFLTECFSVEIPDCEYENPEAEELNLYDLFEGY